MEIRKYCELKEYKNDAYENLQNEAKVEQRKFNSNGFGSHLTKPEKEGQTKQKNKD